jgi:hypothetical protein
LPRQAGILPGDRAVSPEFAGFTSVYHRRQYLLVPLTFGNQSRKLFILATGMRFSAMTSETAHEFSKITVNFTNTEQTAQGGKAQFYREIFDMQFANLPQIHQGHILELDPAIIDRNAGFEIAGMLGLDLLHTLTLSLDYRDGLVKFESTESETPTPGKETMIASGASAPASDTMKPICQPGSLADRPINSTIEAKVMGSLDSAHLKPGKEIWVKVIHGLLFPGCTLEQDSVLYGRVLTATSSKNSNGSELSLAFDHGDCEGHAKKELPLRLIGLAAPPAESERLHDAMPTEVSGGGRRISDTVEGTNAVDLELNPGGPPHTVHPGVVVHMPDTKLEPEGGPGCSAKITSTNRSVQLGVGSELILTMLSPQ